MNDFLFAQTERLTITKSSLHGVDVFHFRGEIDHFTVDGAEDYFETEGVHGPRVVFDLRKLEYLSSACSRLFLPVLRKTREQGGDLKFCGIQGKCRIVFETLGLDRLTESDFDLPSSAVEAFQKPLKPEFAALFQEGYYATVKGRTFHLPVCRHVLRRRKETLLFFKSIEEAIRASKEPCRICKPV